MLKRYHNLADVFFDGKHNIGTGMATQFGLSSTFASLNTIEDIASNQSAINEISQNFDALYSIFQSPTATAKFYASDYVLGTLIANETFREWTFNNEQVSQIISSNDETVRKLLCQPTNLDFALYEDVRDLTSDETAITAIANNALASYFLSKMPEIFRIAIETDTSLDILAQTKISRELISNSRRCVYVFNANDKQTLRWVLSGTIYNYNDYGTIAIFRDANAYVDLMGLAQDPNGLYRAIRCPAFTHTISAVAIPAVRFLCAATGQEMPDPLTWAGLFADTVKLNALFSPANHDTTIRILKKYSSSHGLTQWTGDVPYIRLMSAVTGFDHTKHTTIADFRLDQDAAIAVSQSKDALYLGSAMNTTYCDQIVCPLWYHGTWNTMPNTIPPLNSNNDKGYRMSGNVVENAHRIDHAGRAQFVFRAFSQDSNLIYIRPTESQNILNLGYNKLNVILEVPEGKEFKPNIFIRKPEHSNAAYATYHRDAICWGSTNGYSWFQLNDSYNYYARDYFPSGYYYAEEFDLQTPIKYFKYEWAYDARTLYDRGWLLSEAQ